MVMLASGGIAGVELAEYGVEGAILTSPSLIARVVGCRQFLRQPDIIINQIVNRNPSLVGIGFQCKQVRLAHSSFEVRYLPTIHVIRKTQTLNYPVLGQSQTIAYLS